MDLPEGKEDIIARGGGSPTRKVWNAWIDMVGKKANVWKLLEVLEKCKQGNLAHKIEQKLGVEFPEQPRDIVDGVRNMNVEGNRRGRHCLFSES